MEGIVIEVGKYGPRGIITAQWREEMATALANVGIRELELNDGKGWKGTNLAFLRLLPPLRSLIVIDLRLRSDTEIHDLHELRELELITYCESEIKFFAFPELKRCALQWRTKANSIFDCLSLTDLFIDRYDGEDMASFSKLINLQSLALMNSPVETLLGLDHLIRVRSLRLGRLVCLTSLNGIEGLHKLEDLEIQRCRRIRSLKQIAGLSNLRTLNVNDCGEIESLKPLINLKQLQSVLFYGSTNILDGDLTPLRELPNLARVSFQNRNHYSHRRQDFGMPIPE